MKRRRCHELTGWALCWLAVLLSACAERTLATHQVVVRAESDPGKPLSGVRLATQGSPLGDSDAKGEVNLRLVGNPGDVVLITATCPVAYRPPGAPLQVVLRPTAENKRPEYRVSCAPLKRSMVLAVRAQNGPNLPVLHLGKEIARTDAAGAAHALIDAAPGETITATLDTRATAHARLMPQNPELKVVVADRDDIVVFDQAFMLPPERKVRRRHVAHRGPDKITGPRRTRF